MELYQERPAESQFAKMQKIFEERDHLYQQREKEHEKRQFALKELSNMIAKSRQELEYKAENVELREKEILEKAKRLEEKEASLHQGRKELEKQKKSFSDQMRDEKAESGRIQTELMLKQQLALEEIKTEKMRLQQEIEQVEYQKDMNQNGLYSEFDPELYLLRTEVAEKYVERALYEKEVEELTKQRDRAFQEKSELLKRLFEVKQHLLTDVREPREKPVEEQSEVQNEVSEDGRQEKEEDLTAEVLQNYLEKIQVDSKQWKYFTQKKETRFTQIEEACHIRFYLQTLHILTFRQAGKQLAGSKKH